MSNLTRGVLTSSLLQRDVSYSLIIPDGYSTSARRYPTLYLLHGLFGSFENWIDLTNLSEHARGHDLIIVMPDGADGWYTDSSNGGYYESYLIEELLPEIDKLFMTISDRGNRAIAGNSMGGYGSIKFALKFPELFAFAGSFSGAFHAPRLNFGGRGASSEELGPSVMKIFGDDHSRCRIENDLINLAESAVKKDVELPHVYFDCGLNDEFLLANRELSKTFSHLGIIHDYREFEGGHDWNYWDLRLGNLIEMVARKQYSTSR